MCNVLDPMAQKIPMQEQISPQMDPEPEMGAAEAAKYDTSPSPPHQHPPPILAESAQPGTFDMGRLLAVLTAMNEEIKANTREIKNNTNKMDENMRTMWGETQSVGQCLQAGIMATPRAGTNELGGECDGCQARGGGG